MDKELFSLSLDDEGAAQLTKFHKKARWVFIASLVLTAINLLAVIARINTILGVYRYSSRGLSLQLMITLAYLVFTLVMIPFQWYYYFSFSKMMQNSIQDQDNIRFNRSFALLNSHATICMLVIMVNVFYFAYAYYGTWMLRGRF